MALVAGAGAGACAVGEAPRQGRTTAATTTTDGDCVVVVVVDSDDVAVGIGAVANACTAASTAVAQDVASPRRKFQTGNGYTTGPARRIPWRIDTVISV